MVTYIVAALHGLGCHADTIPKEYYKEYLKMTFIQAIVSTIGAHVIGDLHVVREF